MVDSESMQRLAQQALAELDQLSAEIARAARNSRGFRLA
jgi:hypothetical protein